VSTSATSRPGIVHLVLALGGFAIGTTEFATMSLLPYLAHDLQISEPVAGHVISAYAFGLCSWSTRLSLSLAIRCSGGN